MPTDEQLIRADRGCNLRLTHVGTDYFFSDGRFFQFRFSSKPRKKKQIFVYINLRFDFFVLTAEPRRAHKKCLYANLFLILNLSFTKSEIAKL